MTFALKEFSELKKNFDDTVQIILARDLDEKTRLEFKENSTPIAKQIKSLTEPRKSEIQYLYHISNTIENIIKQTKPKSTQLYSEIFYGAMLTTIKNIENNLGLIKKKENSTLYKRLIANMEITDKYNPSPEQYTTFYTELNKFTSTIFNNNNSGEGFKESHFLQKIQLEKMVNLLNDGYLLEKAAKKDEIKLLEIGGQSKANFTGFKLSKEVPKDAITSFENWEKLKKSFHDLTIEELADKNLPDIEKLSAKRRMQLEFLTGIMDCLTNSKPAMKNDMKISIFAGAMYIVRGQIAIEYGHEPLYDKKDIPSVVHTELGKILQANTEAIDNIEFMVNSANHFIRHICIENTNNDKKIKNSIRVEHPFKHIKDFDLKDILNLIQDMICDCRSNALKQCESNQKKQEERNSAKDSKSTSAYFASFWKAKESKIDEDDNVTYYENKHINNSTSTTSTTTTSIMKI